MTPTFKSIFLFFTLITNICIAQESITTSDIQPELYKSKTIDNYTHYVCYYPNEYWRIVFNGNPSVNEETISYLESIFDDYILIMAGKMSINAKKEELFVSENLTTLTKNITLIDNNGKVYKPLKSDEMSQDALRMIEVIQPSLANVMGEMGKGMKIFLFKVQDKNGHNLINSKQNTPFTIKLFTVEFKYDLPLSVYIPKKNCPIDGEPLNGKWNYCPIHGEKLEE